MDGNHYTKFVDEAFIDPIRSVLIVDDDYPTFEEMLADGDPSTKAWRGQRQRVMKLIRSFRDRNLLVDIHDGLNVEKNDEIAEVAHLHQSDLLVLDYELNKALKGDGSIAIDIIRKLMSNSHFNMVVVHTSEPLVTVFESVILALLPQLSCEMGEGDTIKAQDAILDAGDGFASKVATSISTAQYLKFRQVGLKDTLRLLMSRDGTFSAFETLCDEAGWKPHTRKLVLAYQLAEFNKTVPKNDGDKVAQKIEWSEGDVKWARSDTVFLAFSKKEVGDEPMGDLSAALNAWRPDPSRLYLARLQHEIDEYGTARQAQLLGNKHALAGWYNALLKAEKNERTTQIHETIGRHSELLMNSIVPNVVKFAESLIEAERAGDADETCTTHFGIDLSNEAQRQLAESQHNSVVSTKPPAGWHLTTGHVFTFAGDHWVCATPACDMVPSQLSAFRKKIYKNRMPFAAIRLQPVKSLQAALAKATSSRMLFLEIEGSIKTFSFNAVGDDTSAPEWSILFADDLGKLDAATFEFKIIQVEGDDDRLHAKPHEAKVVSQLRYEYALNLVQRLGVSMSRIGLDFLGTKPTQP
ncbi:response regulator receiver domain [Methylorubrum zatmanii]